MTGAPGWTWPESDLPTPLAPRLAQWLAYYACFAAVRHYDPSLERPVDNGLLLREAQALRLTGRPNAGRALLEDFERGSVRERLYVLLERGWQQCDSVAPQSPPLAAIWRKLRLRHLSAETRPAALTILAYAGFHLHLRDEDGTLFARLLREALADSTPETRLDILTALLSWETGPAGDPESLRPAWEKAWQGTTDSLLRLASAAYLVRRMTLGGEPAFRKTLRRRIRGMLPHLASHLTPKLRVMLAEDALHHGEFSRMDDLLTPLEVLLREDDDFVPPPELYLLRGIEHLLMGRPRPAEADAMTLERHLLATGESQALGGFHWLMTGLALGRFGPQEPARMILEAFTGSFSRQGQVSHDALLRGVILAIAAMNRHAEKAHPAALRPPKLPPWEPAYEMGLTHLLWGIATTKHDLESARAFLNSGAALLNEPPPLMDSLGQFLLGIGGWRIGSRDRAEAFFDRAYKLAVPFPLLRFWVLKSWIHSYQADGLPLPRKLARELDLIEVKREK